MKQIVIVGGGTAGWMTAAAICSQFDKMMKVSLIESDQIGTIGVGEATIPPIRVFHQFLGIDEQTFMRETCATFKLGIEFAGWSQTNHTYMHAFGKTGKDALLADFQHYWLRANQLGFAKPYQNYCFEYHAAKADKFSTQAYDKIQYAYHLDATAYAQFLRRYSEKLGLTRIEGKLDQVNLNEQTGHIQSVSLQSGQTISGDLFIDCTGFNALLIEKALKCGFEDWADWLKCDSAITAQTELTQSISPYTQANAHSAGWQWKIPLQSRQGNGLVYASQYMSEQQAQQLFINNLTEKTLTEPKLIQFKTGRRRQNWLKNCVAIGLSSGFIEPLESTSIHLIMSGVMRLLKLFPFNGIKPSLVDEYNRQSQIEIENIRDFVIAHYCVNQRQDSAFWRDYQNLNLPDSLKHKLDLFVQSACINMGEHELFSHDSWAKILLGQQLVPEQYHQITQIMPEQELARYLKQRESAMLKRVNMLPSHSEFIQSYCASK